MFFGVLGVFVFVFRALARIFFGFIFRDEPSKAGNLCPGARAMTPRAMTTMMKFDNNRGRMVLMNKHGVVYQPGFACACSVRA